jgi:hypothetical protein
VPTAATDPAWRRPRPRRRWLDATTILVDFALVTFDVDPGRLAAVLPTGLVPEVRTLDDGRERGFVSAVSFRDVDFRFALAPVVRRSFFQTNYRAYVRGPAGGRAVHFFGTTLDSVWSVIPRRVWGMPWHRGRTSIEATWAGGRCMTYRHRCEPGWGGADVDLTGTDEPLRRLDGFVDLDDAALVLTHPLDGFFARSDGRLGRYAASPRRGVRAPWPRRVGSGAALGPAPAERRVRRAAAPGRGLTVDPRCRSGAPGRPT